MLGLPRKFANALDNNVKPEAEIGNARKLAAALFHCSRPDRQKIREEQIVSVKSKFRLLDDRQNIVARIDPEGGDQAGNRVIDLLQLGHDVDRDVFGVRHDGLDMIAQGMNNGVAGRYLLAEPRQDGGRQRRVRSAYREWDGAVCSWLRMGGAIGSSMVRLTRRQAVRRKVAMRKAAAMRRPAALRSSCKTQSVVAERGQ